jgi:hypothetical protein
MDHFLEIPLRHPLEKQPLSAPTAAASATEPMTSPQHARPGEPAPNLSTEVRERPAGKNPPSWRIPTDPPPA